MAEPTDSTPAPAARTDRSPWNWLLVLPIVLPVLTPIYNFDSPRLWGFPAFYWLQFAFIIVGVVTTSVVYRMTRRPAGTVVVPMSSTRPVASSEPAASEPAASEPAASEPVPSEPVPSEPVPSEPVPSEPVASTEPETSPEPAPPAAPAKPATPTETATSPSPKEDSDE